MLQALLALALFFSLPQGFGETDRFLTIEDACMTLSFELPPKKHRAQVFDWCQRRTRASSRGKRIVSRVDGSWIHDRDRAAAWPMYKWGLRSGRIDPGTCATDAIDTGIKHSKATRKLRANWPFENPEMTPARLARWKRSPADAERFGTRGPHDNNVTVARQVLPGCWSPESLDRNDVAATVTVMRAAAICEKHGCRNNRDIKRWW